MEVLGFTITLSNLISLLTFCSVIFAGWYNLKRDVKELYNFKQITETKIDHLETKATNSEREMGVVNAHLTTIQSQVGGISNRIDTLINYLLQEKQK